MTTAGDLLNRAARKSGVLGTGQTMRTQDGTDALNELNAMLAQWARRRWLVYHLIDTGFACTGAQSYSVGIGGNFNIARPDRIEAAFLRQIAPDSPTPIDYPLEIIESMEEYSRIAMKGLTASPSDALFYDSGYPLGSVKPWPVPSNAYELHILTKAALQGFPDLSTVILLPPEYEDALDWNMRARLRSGARLPLDSYVVAQAKATLMTVKRSNVQLDRLAMPRMLRRSGRYNLLADRGR